MALRKILTVGSVSLLAVFGGTATASAQSNPPPNGAWVHMHNEATTRCIDDSDFKFRTNDCNNSFNQTWAVAQYSDGSYRFENMSTFRCIDDSDFGFRTNICNNSVYQRWAYIINSTDPSAYALKNLGTGRCIDDSDFGFRTNTCNLTAYQTFFDTPYTNAP
ncbi:Ricin B lectin [Amycolatopsis vancoresmycina DSM 44592]|uniref:Ricin B lectin n=1 Tax=Amycolatopsis vancoresmycina DSM 44592 TaxID=1292037 RepID=R1I1R4_9PSEU|nr:Ricin B lectin [Amycolatopsis vancoresmycina DSM 44592]